MSSVDHGRIYNSILAKVVENYGRLGLYPASNRKEALALLVQSFYERGVSYEDAKSYKRRVMRDFITKDGIKFSNKKGHRYFGWLDNLEMDFDFALESSYELPPVQQQSETVIFKEAVNDFMLDRNEKITEWVIENYGNNESLISQAHDISHPLCVEYFAQLPDGTNENYFTRK